MNINAELAAKRAEYYYITDIINDNRTYSSFEKTTKTPSNK
jgi:hypothetical protein